MVLDSLLELVETLRKRIDEHGAALRQSEALTRAALIDPLLRELGWDTEDPAMVMPEYRLGRGYADYALLSDGKPMIMVEAKKLGTPLQDAASQGIGYCIEDGIGYFAVTDGRQWQIYETHKMAPISEKLTVQFNIEQSLPITCLRALALWRPAVEQGSVMAGETPIAELDPVERDAAEKLIAPPILEPEPTPQEKPTIRRTLAAVAQSRETSQEWKPLTEVNPPPRGRPPHPKEMMFPDGSRSLLKAWNSIPIEATRWLTRNDHIDESHTPIRAPRARGRYILNGNAVHLDGKPFREPRQIEGLFLEVDYSGLLLAKNTCTIIQHVGQEPSQFKVRLSS